LLIIRYFSSTLGHYRAATAATPAEAESFVEGIPH
jgi:hypothetical protein